MPRRKKEDLPQEELKKIKTPPMIKGMRDVLPADEKYWDAVEEKIRSIVRDYTFKRLRTPVLEKYELFSHVLAKPGIAFDKEVFSFIDRGEKVILRPDLIAPMVRSYLEHNMANQPMPVKLYDWGPVFRQGRQEESKDRQYTQVHFEILGDSAAAIDAELIIEAYYFMKNLGLATEIKLNSAGCLVCRLEYNKALNGYLKSKRGLVCGDCRKAMGRTPQKFLTCQNAKCVRLKEEAPQGVDWLCESCRSHLFKVLEYLDTLGVAYQLDPQLIRQSEFSMRTNFEIRTPFDANSETVVLASGGRHDYLVEMLGGPATPAVGFSIELEKVVQRMKTAKVEVAPAPGPDVFVAQISEAARQKSFEFFERLRGENFSVRANLSKSSLKAQLEMATKMKAKLVVILGQKEVNEGTVLLRDVDSGIQEVVNSSKIVNEVKKRLKEKKDM